MDDSTDDARPTEPLTSSEPHPEDTARPDQLESEMLFGETIAWMRPNSPLFRPEPEPEPEPVVVEETTKAAPVLDQFALPPTAVAADEGDDGGRNRKRALVIGGAVLALVVAGGAAFALTSGGGDDAKVATGTPATTTTVAPTTTTAPAPTIPPSEGTEKETAAGTQVTVKSDVLFDVNSSDLTPETTSRRAHPRFRLRFIGEIISGQNRVP